MQLALADDLIETVQLGVSEPFPSSRTPEAILGWMARNDEEIHELSYVVLEDLIAEQTATRH